MQDTAEGFGQPIRHIFQAFFTMERELPSPFDTRRATGHGRRPDLARALRAARRNRAADGGFLAWLQQGRISAYLLYSFVTLVVLLAVVL